MLVGLKEVQFKTSGFKEMQTGIIMKALRSRLDQTKSG